MHRALLAMLTETVTHAAYLSQDAYGKPVYATPTSVAARVEYQVRRVVDATGQERVSRARLFLDGDLTIDLRDKITLIDGITSPILAIYSPRELNGTVSHHEIDF